MCEIKVEDIAKLIIKSVKIADVDQKTYHKRLSLTKNMSSPTADIKVSRTSGPFSSIESLKVTYGFEEIFITSDKSIAESLINLIKKREDELKEAVIIKKKQEFLKLIED